MIDIDLLDHQLESALEENLRGGQPAAWPAARPSPPEPVLASPPRSPRPATHRAAPAAKPRRPRVAPGAPLIADPGPVQVTGGTPSGVIDHGRRITALVAEGRLAEADVHIAAHAELAARRGGPADRRDAAAWVSMRALLDGRGDDARAGADTVLRLGREADDPDAWSRHLAQRFWIVLEWGTEDERFTLLDQCRTLAYTHGELPWQGALTLLLARLGRWDEARRDLDATAAGCEGLPRDAVWLDLVTNLADAAATMGDAERARSLHLQLARVPDQLVVVGRAWVCKGSVNRYRAGLAAALGSWAEADESFRAATDAHRALGARPLLARTLQDWGLTLAGRDDLLARRCLQEVEELADELGLVSPSRAADPALSTSA